MEDDGTDDQSRPDGRISSPETLKLRTATRALRLHLDELPADFEYNGAADRFFTSIAFVFARQRYGCADSLIGASFGGTVLGSIARSLFDDGLRWQWIGQSPHERRAALLGSMVEERDRICKALGASNATCANLPRWFAPLIGITDLTGASEAWLQAPTLPGQGDLLQMVSSESSAPPDRHAGTAATTLAGLFASARQLVALSGLRGAANILEHAGHGNLLGTESSLTQHGRIGHDLRPDHEALFMQVAAVGVTLTLFGVSAALPENWPPEVEQLPFLETALRLTQAIVEAATAIHGLGAPRTSSAVPRTPRRTASAVSTGLLHAGVVIAAEDLMLDVNSTVEVVGDAQDYFEFAHSWAPDLWANGSPNLASVLTFAGASSSLLSVISTYDEPGSEVIAVFAARMLLEDAARFVWMTTGTEQEIAARFKSFFDDYRYRRSKTLTAFSGSGVAHAHAKKVLELPPNIVIATPHDAIAKGRRPLPTITEMLLVMGQDFPEQGWIKIAYSLLSQVTHSTPIGHLHMLRLRDGEAQGNTISPELLGLTLDAACLGSAHLLGLSSVLLTGGSQEAKDYANELLRKAAGVHNTARMVHGLD